MDYQVDFSYTVPEWSDVTLQADSEDEAKEKARQIIDELYPEAMDIEIDNVRQIASDGETRIINAN